MSLVARLIDALSASGARWNVPLQALLVPGALDPIVHRERRDLIVARIRMVALAFAALTPAWGVIDAAFLGSSLWVKVLIARFAAGGAFIALAAACGRQERAADESVCLGILFAIPLAFFLYAAPLVAGESGVIIDTAYLYLPFMIATGLALFPLTASEGLVLGGAVVLVGLAAQALLGEGIDGGGLWLLTVVAIACACAAVAQLHLLAALVQHSARDPLTGALSRRVGLELLAAHLHVARRHGGPLTLAFIDLDRFKSVNDRYGHEAGDGVLRQAAERMREVFRRQDVVIRWGGEEFVAVFPNTGPAGARRALERLGAAGLAVRPDGRPQTASAGIAAFAGDDPSDPGALVAAADRRMYEAKQAGRNRVCDDSGRISPFQPDAPTPSGPPHNVVALPPARSA